MPKSVFLSTHDLIPTPGSRGGCTFDDRIRIVNHLPRLLTCYSIPGPPLTPQDFVSYLLSQGIEVGIMPQGIGEADVDAWAVQNLRFDAGWVCGFNPLHFLDRLVDDVYRSTESRTEGSPRSKPSRSHLRTSTPCSASILAMTKKSA